jgi:pyruvate dehydrogenase E2 component (dihydrolipoamide acetyltransferase)
MPIVAVRIPQIGEGLQEARLVAVLKQPGDAVRRDEPIYQMETDKAVMDVESPYEGTLVEWLGEPDQVLAIGAEVARMDVAGEVTEMTVHGGPVAPAPAPALVASAVIPPRTRAYAKEKGIDEATLGSIPSASGKLMPADIDAFLVGAAPAAHAEWDETPVPAKQRVLASRLVRGNQIVVPGTISVAASWEAIENERARIKAAGGDFQPSAFTMFAYAVVRAMKEHPGFRSQWVGEGTLRTYRHVDLGIAVALPGDELVLAVVEDADTLDWPTFGARTREQIEKARAGNDQASEAVTVSLTNMQAFGLRDAVPVVVPPSMATIFLGETYAGLDQTSSEPKLRRLANVAMTFDHRLVNGVGASNFLQAIRQNIESIAGVLG